MNQLNEPNKMYAVKIKDMNIRMKSSSGGVFYGLAKYVLDLGGIVYGCQIDENLKIVHKRAVNIDQAMKFMGSKYVQSSMSGIYDLLRNDLENGKMVLFTGTPCQCAAVKKYADSKGLNSNNLLTLDFVCHGVVPPKNFEEFIQYIERQYDGKVISFNFRDKEKNEWGGDNGVKGFSFNLKKRSGHIEYIYSKDINNLWYGMFLGNYILRESCYSCKYTSYNRISDFTCADYWGCKVNHTDFFDVKGVSMLFTNTEKACETFEKIKGMYEYIEIQKKHINQGPLRGPSAKRKDYDKFWNIYNNKGCEKAYEYRIKCIRKETRRQNIKAMLKKAIPDCIIIKLKKFKNRGKDNERL